MTFLVPNLDKISSFMRILALTITWFELLLRPSSHPFFITTKGLFCIKNWIKKNEEGKSSKRHSQCGDDDDEENLHGKYDLCMCMCVVYPCRETYFPTTSPSRTCRKFMHFLPISVWQWGFFCHLKIASGREWKFTQCPMPKEGRIREVWSENDGIIKRNNKRHAHSDWINGNGISEGKRQKLQNT